MPRSLQFLFLTVAISLLAFGCKKPEEKLAGHIEELGEIMEDNADEPKEGLEEAREYLQDNLPEMMALAGEMVVELDKIEDPKEKAERAKEMTSTLESAVKSVQKSAMKFAGKAMDDKEAMEYLEKWGESWEGMEGALDAVSGVGNLM